MTEIKLEHQLVDKEDEIKIDTQICQCATAEDIINNAVHLLYMSRNHEGHKNCAVSGVVALLLALRVAFRCTAVAEAQKHDRERAQEITEDFFDDMQELCDSLIRDLGKEIMNRTIAQVFERTGSIQ